MNDKLPKHLLCFSDRPKRWQGQRWGGVWTVVTWEVSD